MKFIHSIFLFFLFFSCLDSKPKDELLIEYKFENRETANIEKQKTIKVLKDRFSAFGITNSNIFLNSRGNIEIKTTTDLKVERVNNLVENQGKLDFWEVFSTVELRMYLSRSNDLLEDNYKKDSLNFKPFLSNLFPATHSFSGELFNVAVKDTADVVKSITSIEARSVLPPDYRYLKFIYGVPNDEGSIPLYGVKGNREGKALINAQNITRARQSIGYNGNPSISIQMDQKGSLRWERLTEKAYENQTQIAIVLNNIVYSAPGVSHGSIHGGASEISGNFTLDEAQILAVILSSRQSIPKLRFVKSTVIKPKEE